MKLAPVSELSAAELIALWTAAYEGYYVPLVFDEAMLARHVRRSQIDLGRSLVAWVDDRPAAFSLAAIRGATAWIGGFGVTPAFRRRGLASRLMASHLARLEADGVTETWLEVIDVNPAREVYRRCGFAETRELLVYEGEPAAGADAGVPLTDNELLRAHSALRPPPSWRRDLPTILDGLQEGAVAMGIERGGSVAAYALAFEHGGRLILFDAAAADASAGEALLGALGARWPGLPVRLVEEAPDTPLALAMQASGFGGGLRQFEMRRVLANQP